MKIRKSPSSAQLESLLREGGVELPPLSLKVEAVGIARRSERPDALISLEWHGKRHWFSAETSSEWTPKAIAQRMERARRQARPPESHPLIIAPYLPEARLSELEAAGVSGVDLCGNGVVIVPGELYVRRVGQPNRFRSKAEIKNVFQGVSSLVSRVFLLVPEFPSVQAVQREIEDRGGSATLPTISKVCKSLDSLLIVERLRTKGAAARRLRLLQPEKLLDLLASNYEAIRDDVMVRGKTRLPLDVFTRKLEHADGAGLRIARTGLCSAASYAVMASEPARAFYCENLDATLRILGDAFEPTDRFSNVEFHESRDPAIYFDQRPGLVASPIQAYLELATGDKRSKETAKQIRRLLLTDLERAKREDG